MVSNRSMTMAIATALMVVLAAGILAGGRQEGAAQAGPSSVTYYLWDEPTYVQLVNTYNESGTEAPVDSQFLSTSEYETKLITLLAGGASMDAFMQKRSTDMFTQYANGYIMPLTSMIASSGFDAQAISAYNDAIMIDGEIVALPFRGARYYTYFNKKVFDAAGEPYPGTYVEAGEWTWDKFAEVAERIASGNGDVYGGFLHTWGSNQVMPALQDGVQFITQDGRIDLNESVSYSLRLRKRLEESRAIPTLTDLKVTQTHYSTAFFAGNVGMLVMGEWFPGQLQNAREQGLFEGFSWDDWGVTRMPSNHTDYRTFGNPTFNHVHADARNPQAAFDFLAWAAGPDGARTVAAAGFLPARITDEVRRELRANIPDDESFRYYMEDVPVMPQFYTRYGTRVEQAIGDITESYLLGQIPDSRLDQVIRDRMDEIVKTSD